MREETEAQQGGAGAAPAAPAVRSRAASLPRRGEKAPGARVESQPVTLPLDSSSIPGASGCARRGARRALGQSRSGGSELCQLWYKTVVTPRRAVVAITGCWILSFVVGLTPMFGWNNLRAVERDWLANGSVGEPVIECQFEKVISMEYMVYFNFFVWVLPPLLLMVLIYMEVFYLIRKQLNKKVSASSGDPQKYYGKELKIAKSLALILFLFALSWLPLHILNCVTLFCPSCRMPRILIYIAIFLSHGNSAMNPIVYAFRIQKFRVTFLKIWNDHFRCQPVPPVDEDPPAERPDD
ncbi:PREDICTED: adenosine receptor A1 isoform X2 [Capra hircus]|uniref:adenosine receptor A1 isoform X2 n=1 Tax=Capra hircus TaxID=9925 RepID=UPI000846AECB|nr:PREDICTED: adenosine receptor A1 isoform X2 [Capra hircus]